MVKFKKAHAELDDILDGRSNNSFNRSAYSAAFIEHLDDFKVVCAPVNSVVRRPAFCEPVIIRNILARVVSNTIRVVCLKSPNEMSNE
jgi:hypothetical protein